MPTLVTTIDLLRHGEPEGGEMFRGHTDLPLTELGWQQMHGALEAEVAPWQRIFSSPLQRCCNFAEQIAAVHGLPHQADHQLREISFGDWDGMSFEQVRQQHQTALTLYWQDVVENTPPNGESMQAFNQRVISSWQQLLSSHAGEHLLLITHGGVIRVLLAAVLNMPLKSITRLNVPYACLSRVQVYQTEGEFPWLQLQFHQGRLS